MSFFVTADGGLTTAGYVGCGGAGGGTGAAAGRQCDARSQNSQNLIFQVHKNTFFLDAVDLFRYNKNESRTHSIATDFKIERNFP